jgi:hypothetical protein
MTDCGAQGKRALPIDYFGRNVTKAEPLDIDAEPEASIEADQEMLTGGGDSERGDHAASDRRGAQQPERATKLERGGDEQPGDFSGGQSQWGQEAAAAGASAGGVKREGSVDASASAGAQTQAIKKHKKPKN